MSGESDLRSIVELLLVTTPGYVRMRAHPELHSWAAQLVEFGRSEKLRPLAPALEFVATSTSSPLATRERSLRPLREALHAFGATIPPGSIQWASAIALERASQQPYACFALAWVALLLWIEVAQQRGEDLYGEGPPMPRWPHPGWSNIPEAAIATSVRLKGLYGSALLATEAHTVLWASVYRHPDERSALAPAIATYRRLGLEIARRRELAIGGLVDELRTACGDRHGRVRAIVAAILWSLGLIPECGAVLAAEEAPSRSMLRRLVDDSIMVMPDDPLIQYIWLELKEEPSFNLRGHESLFTVVNHRWNQWLQDDMYTMWGMSAGPSRLYARALIRLLADDLDEEGAAEYLAAIDQIDRLGHDVPASRWIRPRFQLLRHLIGLRFDYYPEEVTEARHVEHFQWMLDAARRQRSRMARYPDIPDARGRLGPAVFELIERSLGDYADLPWSDHERNIQILEGLERYRSGALAYWLRVAPPLLPEPDVADVRRLLMRERTLLARYRGSYFLVLRSSLPIQFAWHDMDMDRLIGLRKKPGARERFYSPDVARDEMDEVERKLAKIGCRMLDYAPGPGARRLKPQADFGRVVELLNAHVRPAPPS